MALNRRQKEGQSTGVLYAILVLLGAKCKKGDVSQGCGSLILGRDPAGVVPHFVACSMRELDSEGRGFV